MYLAGYACVADSGASAAEIVAVTEQHTWSAWRSSALARSPFEDPAFEPVHKERVLGWPDLESAAYVVYKQLTTKNQYLCLCLESEVNQKITTKHLTVTDSECWDCVA